MGNKTKEAAVKHLSPSVAKPQIRDKNENLFLKLKILVTFSLIMGSLNCIFYDLLGDEKIF